MANVMPFLAQVNAVTEALEKIMPRSGSLRALTKYYQKVLGVFPGVPIPLADAE